MTLNLLINFYTSHFSYMETYLDVHVLTWLYKIDEDLDIQVFTASKGL